LIKSILQVKTIFYEVAMKSILPLAELYHLLLLHTFDPNEEWAPQYRGAGVGWVGGLNIRALTQESSVFSTRPWLLAWVMTNVCFKIVTKQLFYIDFKSITWALHGVDVVHERGFRGYLEIPDDAIALKNKKMEFQIK
jgi:hypothetical protein